MTAPQDEKPFRAFTFERGKFYILLVDKQALTPEQARGLRKWFDFCQLAICIVQTTDIKGFGMVELSQADLMVMRMMGPDRVEE